MNNYILLDGKRYATQTKAWTPTVDKPNTIRKTLAGELDVTYGPGAFEEWIGTVEAPVTPISSSWGSIQDLRATLLKRASVEFEDHYGIQRWDVHCIGPFKERSLSPMWDALSNIWFMDVKIVKEKVHG
jgi:hypothetical protein